MKYIVPFFFKYSSDIYFSSKIDCNTNVWQFHSLPDQQVMQIKMLITISKCVGSFVPNTHQYSISIMLIGVIVQNYWFLHLSTVKYHEKSCVFHFMTPVMADFLSDFYLQNARNVRIYQKIQLRIITLTNKIHKDKHACVSFRRGIFKKKNIRR